MATGILQLQKDPMESPAASSGPRFRPYASPNHQVAKGRYITSNDPRGYIPVYEYPLNGQWIMMDIDDGYILWTSIWKALGNSKADIVKMIDSQPDLAPLIRRVRGGYLKIQGTWMPYEIALKLSRRVAWPIRDQLIPLFGPTFPSTCLSPDQPGFGQVVPNPSGRRRARRNTTHSATASMSNQQDPHAHWTIVTPTSGNIPSPTSHRRSVPTMPILPAPSLAMSSRQHEPNHYPHSHRGYDNPVFTTPISHPHDAGSSMMARPASVSPRDTRPRYAPYGNSPPSSHRRGSIASDGSHPHSLPSLHQDDTRRQMIDSERIVIPPIQQPANVRNTNPLSYALPPISAMEDMRGIYTHDSAAVLRRLALDDPPTDYEDRRWGASRQENRNYMANDHSSSGAHRYRSEEDAADRRKRRSYSTSSSSQASSRPKNGSSLKLDIPSSSGSNSPRQDGGSTCDTSPMSPVTPGEMVSAHSRPLASWWTTQDHGCVSEAMARASVGEDSAAWRGGGGGGTGKDGETRKYPVRPW